MAPFNPFTKIWRLRNSGCTIWPSGTQVIWVGGDQFAVQNSVKLGISMYGIAGGEEVDVAVDFLAPAKPGRYASYWRLASPSGKKFGQRIWVLIQVEEPIQTSGNKLPAAIDLNLPPAPNRTALKPFIDTNSLPKDPFFKYPLSIYNEILPHYQDSVIHLESELEPDSLTAPKFQFPNDGETSACFQKSIMLKESEPASSILPSISAAVKQVQIPTTDHTTSSGLALTSMAAAVPAPETIPLPKSVSFAVPVSAPIVDAPASFPGHAPTNVPTSALPGETINQKEKLLRELVELGFGQVELNREMLRRNNYDLEESVRELCSLDDWDPLFGELNELALMAQR
jgi:next-to-BRCA1 protein 1